MSHPFHTVDDLSQFFLWPLLTRRQQSDVLAIEDCAERHTYFAECLAINGYPTQAGERISVQDLTASIAAYVATLDDVEQLRDSNGLTSREVSLSELSSFLLFLRRAEPGSES